MLQLDRREEMERTHEYAVMDYRSGARLTGLASVDLVDASLAEESGTGAVGAYRSAGVWQYLREDEMGTVDDARVVYVIKEDWAS
jgi:hypothetical protein